MIHFAGAEAAVEFLFAASDPFPAAAAAAPSINSNEEHKLCVVVRSDLGMSSGKIAAQCSHAALAAARSCAPQLVIEWMQTGEKIVVLGCSGAAEIGRITASAQQSGVTASEVNDAGRTEVESGTLTCVAIGPGAASNIDQITGHLHLLE